MSPDASYDAETQAQLAALEAQAKARRSRLARMLRSGSLVVAASFLFFLRADLVYATRSSTPHDLGGPLEFDFTAEKSQSYVSAVALPGELRATVDHMGQHYQLFGLLGTNILVEQDLSELTPEQQPERSKPFHVAGRLVRDDDASELRRLFELFEARGIVSRQEDHLFVLVANDVPRKGFSLWFELAGIVLFVAVNWLGARRIENPIPTVSEPD
jgi:hypothetical protein